MNKAPLIATLILVVVASALILFKTTVMGYSMSELADEPGYLVRLNMLCTGSGGDVNIRLTLPLMTERQFILREKQSGPRFAYTIYPEGGNRIGFWRGRYLEGEHTITYSFLVQPEERQYTLPAIELIPEEYPQALTPYLQAEERIQSDAPLIRRYAEICAAGSRNVPEVVEHIYSYLQKEVDYRSFRGPTDALTALKLSQASCNGRNRLFVALCRSLGIPARIAGGLILKSGSKRTTHSWTEVWIDGRWVPFCTVNDYFAKIPAHYLELYKGDRALITRTKNVGFEYQWKIKERVSTKEELLHVNAGNELNILRTWARFKDVHISINLLLIILTLPVGATLITFCRNIIGIRTFGTFMPALMAIAFRDTGLVYGVITFLIVITVGQVSVWLLNRLNLLHIPKMAILLTVVVMTILLLATLALETGHMQAAAVSLFPLAVVTITAERFSVSVVDEGLKQTSLRFISSLVVAAGAFEVMQSDLLQQIIISFPEVLLYVVAINILIGLWTGLRFTEYIRFRDLLTEAK